MATLTDGLTAQPDTKVFGDVFAGNMFLGTGIFEVTSRSAAAGGSVPMIGQRWPRSGGGCGAGTAATPVRETASVTTPSLAPAQSDVNYLALDDSYRIKRW